MTMVTLEGLIKHFDKFGLDKVKGGRHRKEWVEPNYTTYRQLREDALIATGRQYLNADDYIDLVRHIAGDEIADAAIKWELGEEDEDGS